MSAALTTRANSGVQWLIGVATGLAVWGALTALYGPGLRFANHLEAAMPVYGAPGWGPGTELEAMALQASQGAGQASPPAQSGSVWIAVLIGVVVLVALLAALIVRARRRRARRSAPIAGVAADQVAHPIGTDGAAR
jgi:hypothetical protein